MSTILILVILIVFGVLLVKALSKPIRFIFKLLINTAIGFVVLFIIDFFGMDHGIYIEMTKLNALITGFFGFPGVIFLLLWNWLM